MGLGEFQRILEGGRDLFGDRARSIFRGAAWTAAPVRPILKVD